MSRTTLAVALFAAALAGCASSPGADPHAGHAAHTAQAAEPAVPLPTEAVTVMTPTAGNTAHGWVRFSARPNGVRVHAVIEGLAPDGVHAFHVHEWGDVSSADGTACGGHYNPEGHHHAGPDTPERHAGDLGNLRADATGRAEYVIEVDNLTIAGPRNPVIGRSVIVHAGVDDYATQPTGNAGARIAQGVVGVAKPEPAK